MIIVTGGAGFIGSNVIRALNNRGITDIIVVDNLTDGRKCANLADKKFIDYYDCNEFVTRAANKLAEHGLNGIIHLGAISDTTVWNGRELMTTNYAYSKLVFAIAAAAECPFIYASSAGVYGTGELGFRELPENERPMTPYAFSKWTFDNFVRLNLGAQADKPSRIVGLRYFNVYGPGEAHKDNMASVIYKWLRAVKHNQRIQIFAGSQDIRRDFIYVEDVAEITVRFLETTHEGIYNVGTGVATSFLDVAELIAHDAVDIDMVPFPEELRPTYQRHTCADTSKLRANLELPPNWFTPIDAGVERYRKELFD